MLIPKNAPISAESSARLETLKSKLGPEEKLEVLREFSDTDFVDAFLQHIPEQEQINYIRNTLAYHLSGEVNEYDPNYVLVFRRALKNTDGDEKRYPKPEEHWTTNFIIARNGLRHEIPEGPHRHHTVIKCSTLGRLIEMGYDENFNAATSDGEIKIIPKPFNGSLFSFKSIQEQRLLEQYLSQPDALSLEEVTAQVIAIKNGGLRRDVSDIPDINTTGSEVEDVW